MNTPPPGMQLVDSDLTWQPVLETWKENEGQMEVWTEFAIEKGYDGWKEWRTAWIAPLGLEGRKWSIYKIEDPLVTIPRLHVGPTRGWQSKMPESMTDRTFGALVRYDRSLDNHSKIREISDNFPDNTQLIALRMHDGRLVLLEGHHRAAAISISAREGRTLDSRVRIAITDFSEEDEVLVSNMLARGSIYKEAKVAKR